jgi:hypothetical protein
LLAKTIAQNVVVKAAATPHAFESIANNLGIVCICLPADAISWYKLAILIV